MNLAKLKKLNLPAGKAVIPKSPGVYQFLNNKDKIIYIGKAADLKSRVMSYWPSSRALELGRSKSADHSPAKQAMLKQVAKIKWIETDSQIEALLLEANLIKKYQPDFNVIMRDDKRFCYIKISTEDEWPRVFMTRKLDKTGKYFGPFISSEAVRETLKIIRKIWPYRSCRIMPKKTCLYYRINKCPGMCENLISQADYKKIIKQIDLFLQGKKKHVISVIKKEIKLAERNNNQAKADYLNYQLMNFNKVLEHSNIVSLSEKYATDVVELAKLLHLKKVPQRIEGYDVSNIFGQEAVGSMVVFTDGEPDKNEYRKFKIKVGQGEANDIRMLKEVLERRFKHTSPPTPLLIRRGEEGERWQLPDLIIIDGGKAQLNVAIRAVKRAGFDPSTKLRTGIPIIAISKGSGLRSAQAPDKLFFPGEKMPLELPLASPALHLLKRVRDEAHRFAISYHRLLRKKKLVK